MMNSNFSYNDKIYIYDLDGDDEDKFSFLSFNDQVKFVFIFLTRNGFLKLNNDNQEIIPDQNVLLTLLPFHLLQIQYVSVDYKGIVLKISKDFLFRYCESRGSYTINNLFRLQKAPCISITSEDNNILLKKLEEIKNRIRNRNHLFYRFLIENIFEGFMLDINNLILKKQILLKNPFFSRKEELSNSFFDLLHRCYFKEHSLVFYADKLCISPKYLSLVIKQQTGKTANQWIEDALFNEAINLLKNSNTPIKEIAFRLRFSDQSSFGKFFKKHKFISPLRYRRTILS